MIAGLVCTLAACGLVVVGLRVLQREGRRYAEASLSMFCAAGGLLVWPTATALAVDRVVHVAGLAHVLTDSLIPLTFILQFRFTHVLSGVWTPRLKRLFYGVVALVVLHAALWSFDGLTVPGDHRTLWYNHYFVHPSQLLLTYLVLSASIISSAACCIYGYLASLRTTQPGSERLTAAAISTIAAGAILYAVLIAAQVVSSAAGGNPAAITAYTVPLMSLCAVVALAVVLAVLFGRRAWSLLRVRVIDQQTIARIRRDAERLERIQNNMVNLAIAIDERLLRVRQDYAAAAAVEAVTQVCNVRGLDPQQRKVAREAVRIVTLSYDNVSEPPFYESDELAERTGMAEYYLLQANGSYFFDDVYRVAFLAIGGEALLPLEDLPEEIDVQVWHRDLATIVANALHEHKGGNGTWSA